MLTAWLRFFRVVNLPTVPGDVLVGAALAVHGAGWSSLPDRAVARIAAAAAVSVFVYLFGLADNDICGAATDRDRPIPEGLVSLRAARVARALCWLAVLAAGAVAALPPSWWALTLALLLACVAYNRTKSAVLMGLCRGLNVLCGAAALMTAWDGLLAARTLAVGALWTLYIAGVTRFSEGEEDDPERRRRVGWLIGALVYLQLSALIVLTLMTPAVSPLMVGGAALLILLRLTKWLLPSVRAS